MVTTIPIKAGLRRVPRLTPQQHLILAQVRKLETTDRPWVSFREHRNLIKRTLKALYRRGEGISYTDHCNLLVIARTSLAAEIGWYTESIERYEQLGGNRTRQRFPFVESYRRHLQKLYNRAVAAGPGLAHSGEVIL